MNYENAIAAIHNMTPEHRLVGERFLAQLNATPFFVWDYMGDDEFPNLLREAVQLSVDGKSFTVDVTPVTMREGEGFVQGMWSFVDAETGQLPPKEQIVDSPQRVSLRAS